MEGIIREASEEEKRNFVDLSVKKKSVFEEQIATKEQEVIGTHTPFCVRCARLEYNDKIKSVMQELERAQGFADPNDKRVTEIDINLEQYGKSDRFTLLATSPITENKLIDGVRIPYTTGYMMKYQCKKRGCGISVEVPLDYYNEHYNKNLKVPSPDKKI